MVRRPVRSPVDELVCRERPRLVGFFLKRLESLHTELAQDLAQEAITVVLETRGVAADGNAVASPRAYLYTVARNLLAALANGSDPFTRRKLEDVASGPESAETFGDVADEAPPESAESETVQLTLARQVLGPVLADPRNRFLVLQADGLTCEELARERESSNEALRAHLNLRRQALRRQFADQLVELLAA